MACRFLVIVVGLTEAIFVNSIKAIVHRPRPHEVLVIRERHPVVQRILFIAVLKTTPLMRIRHLVGEIINRTRNNRLIEWFNN